MTDPIKLLEVIRQCSCRHCFYLLQLVYDPKKELVWGELMDKVDGIIKHEQAGV